MEVHSMTSNTLPKPAAIPSPSVMAKFAPRLVSDVTPTTPTPAPGTHDGIVKTKHLKTGMTVRAWFNGEPHGGERIVAEVVKAEADGSTWTVSFSSPHPDQTYKAAYRWFVADLVGTEIPKPRRRRKAPDHLTYKPFAGLSI